MGSDRVRSKWWRRSVVVWFTAIACVLAMTPPAVAGEAIKGKPRIVAVEGFIVPVDESLEQWRAAALVVTRYPRVLSGSFRKQVRKLLRVRARAQLKVFEGGEQIAAARDAGG